MEPNYFTFTRDFVFHTIQGEGKFVGTPSIFLRLSGCNLRCEWQREDGKTNLCDTAYSSHFPEKENRSIDEVLKAIGSYSSKHVVITGGEPFLQANLPLLVERVKQLGHYITIETNGTIYLPTVADFISLSPKLSSSCVHTSANFSEHQQKRFNEKAVVDFLSHHEAQLKFVVNDFADIKEIEEIQKTLELSLGHSINDLIYLMPQALGREELIQKAADVAVWAKEKSWNFSDRLHIRLWGAKRGV